MMPVVSCCSLLFSASAGAGVDTDFEAIRGEFAQTISHVSDPAEMERVLVDKLETLKSRFGGVAAATAAAAAAVDPMQGKPASKKRSKQKDLLVRIGDFNYNLADFRVISQQFCG